MPDSDQYTIQVDISGKDLRLAGPLLTEYGLPGLPSLLKFALQHLLDNPPLVVKPLVETGRRKK